ncbi:glycosyltransferase [Mahella australiensis]|uniref:glycosyltransferase n=1 Tax=Mahella australiensis TaxID=252966 RepID=UPI002478DC80|nr:glycosyltransferase [Mahella australiensis]
MRSKRIALEKLDSQPPKLLAIVIAALHEEKVLEPVIDNLIATMHYPRSMYHIFIGVYPNDEATTAVADALGQKYQNVHTVINVLPGPTSKAQNLNNVISYIRQFELDHDYRFSAITIHDSEDVVHPYELKMTNFLIEEYSALQFPVFPLQRMPNWKNFFSGMTSGTYADEFAENHFRIMRMRDSMVAVVPSAGTGFVLSHEILDYYENQPLFPEDSLTEDYKLSIKLAEDGFHVHYVLEKVIRLLDNGALRWDYIATRSMFPNKFRAAVRQKTRWIYGITMQSIKLSDIFGVGRGNLNVTESYTLYRDLKAKFVNLLVLPGYFVFVYFILSFFTSIPVMYPVNTFSGQLCIFLTFMMIYRQTMRAIAINNVYGFKSVIFACLLPPFMPIRLIWGNIINLSATLYAWQWAILGNSKGRKKTKRQWNKTEHEFLDKNILHRYYRNIGDVLLEKQYIAPKTLKEMLMLSHKENKRLGDVLLENNVVTEEQLMIAVAASQHRLFVKNISLFKSDAANDFDKQLLAQSSFYPLLKVNDGYVIAQTNFTPPDAYNSFIDDGYNIYTVYTTKDRVLEAIETVNNEGSNLTNNLVNELLRQDKITWEQAVLAIDNQSYIPNIIGYMGIGSPFRIIDNSNDVFTHNYKAPERKPAFLRRPRRESPPI